MSSSKWRGWVLAALVFILGAAVGGAGATVIGARFLRRALQAPVASRSLADRATRRIAEDLVDTLKLNNDQAIRVRSILEKSATQMKTIRVQAAQQMAAELSASTEQLAAALPPEKHDEFYLIIAKRYERLGLTPPQSAPR